jgi:hypothetical protein
METCANCGKKVSSKLAMIDKKTNQSFCGVSCFLEDGYKLNKLKEVKKNAKY